MMDCKEGYDANAHNHNNSASTHPLEKLLPELILSVFHIQVKYSGARVI